MVVVVTVMMEMTLVMMGPDDSVASRRKCVFVLRSPFSLSALLTYQRYAVVISSRSEDTARMYRDHKEESIRCPRKWVVSVA